MIRTSGRIGRGGLLALLVGLTWCVTGWLTTVQLPSPPDVLSAGGMHTCALMLERATECWGIHAQGQAAAQPGYFTALRAGGMHTCAVRTNGAVACWPTSP